MSLQSIDNGHTSEEHSEMILVEKLSGEKGEVRFSVDLPSGEYEVAAVLISLTDDFKIEKILSNILYFKENISK